MPVSSQHKVYLPENAKSNQYILAEFKTSPELYGHYVGNGQCYQQLSEQLFNYKSVLFKWETVFSIPIHCGLFHSSFFPDKYLLQLLQ